MHFIVFFIDGNTIEKILNNQPVQALLILCMNYEKMNF